MARGLLDRMEGFASVMIGDLRVDKVDESRHFVIKERCVGAGDIVKACKEVAMTAVPLSQAGLVLRIERVTESIRLQCGQEPTSVRF